MKHDLEYLQSELHTMLIRIRRQHLRSGTPKREYHRKLANSIAGMQRNVERMQRDGDQQGVELDTWHN